jgi:DNA-binding Lrp family transcriptional regulator
LRIPADNVANFLTRLTPFVEEEGARNLNKISDELSIPYQTLRFRMQRLRDQGISIIPIIDPEKLGLARFRVRLELSADIDDVFSFFGGLHQSAGLHYFARSLTSNVFDCEFLLPASKADELSKLLVALEEMSLVENADLRMLLWKEILGMKTRYFDYLHGVWDIDFTRLSGNPSDYEIGAAMSSLASSPRPPKFDGIDLQIIKSLQVDPWIKSVDIARNLKLTDSDISYHARHHVFGCKIVRGFKFKWIGSKESWAKHTVIGMTYVFNSIPDDLARHAMSIFTSCPFTWNHMRSEAGEYIAELLIPVSQMPDTINYLASGLRALKLRPDEINYPDWSCSQNYTIPYLMFNNEVGWEFECERSLGYIIQMIKSQARV